MFYVLYIQKERVFYNAVYDFVMYCTTKLFSIHRYIVYDVRRKLFAVPRLMVFRTRSPSFVHAYHGKTISPCMSYMIHWMHVRTTYDIRGKFVVLRISMPCSRNILQKVRSWTILSRSYCYVTFIHINIIYTLTIFIYAYVHVLIIIRLSCDPQLTQLLKQVPLLPPPIVRSGKSIQN